MKFYQPRDDTFLNNTGELSKYIANILSTSVLVRGIVFPIRQFKLGCHLFRESWYFDLVGVILTCASRCVDLKKKKKKTIILQGSYVLLTKILMNGEKNPPIITKIKRHHI